jgi:hypothetical protein
MPEDSTRRLLKVFGVSVTECEDAVIALLASLRDPAPGGPAVALEAYGKAARELAQRWVEVGRLLADYQFRAHDALAAYLKDRGGAGMGAVQ